MCVGRREEGGEGGRGDSGARSEGTCTQGTQQVSCGWERKVDVAILERKLHCIVTGGREGGRGGGRDLLMSLRLD